MQLTTLCKAVPLKAERPLINQILRNMKMTAVILIVTCLQVSARSDAQTVTLSKKDATLQSIFAEIRKQTGYDFFYEDNLLKDATKVSIEVKNAPLVEVLKLCFATQPFTYTITGTTIILKRKETLEINTDQVTTTPLQSDTIPRVIITGRVQLQDSSGVVLENVNIINRNTGQGATTDANGFFNLLARKGDVLDFSYVGLKSHHFRVNSTDNVLTVNLKRDIREEEAVVVYNTGYQQLPKERATGSFEFVRKEELNRRVGTDILSRLEGVTTSVFFDKRKLSASTNTINADKIAIRGLSTITETPSKVKTPLIILNNFPYDGDINNINPNDIESVTILKDAAAASIWGARAANGVIVLTTKQGKYSQPTQLTVNTSINIIEKPNLFYYPKMSPSDFIDVEIFLFQKGFFNSRLNNSRRPAVTPVVEILARRISGLISPTDSASQINLLRAVDVRSDFERFVYQSSINQQYSLNLTGGSEKMRFSLSGGFDKSPSILVGNNFERATIRSDNSLIPIKNLEIGFGFGFTNSHYTNNSLGNIGNVNYNYMPGQNLYPYAQFADPKGNHLFVPHDYRVRYVDTAGNGKLLDWKYSPLDELALSDNKSRLQDIILNASLNYKLNKVLSTSVSYQYEVSTGQASNYRSPETYYTRNLINLFSQVAGNNVTYIVPPGGIMDEEFSNLVANNIRGQLNYSNNWKEKHSISGFVGSELREAKSSSTLRRLYAFNPDNLSFGNVDYSNFYPQYGNRGVAQISNNDSYSKLLDRYVSVYLNAAYTYNKLYTLSISGRRDASNLFGVDVNNKWKPFWSVGGSWAISKERFFNVKQISDLSLRITYGHQGNVNNSVSAYTVLQITPANGTINNQSIANIVNPADPSLSWENVGQLNIGLNFRLFNNRVFGNLDVFNKEATNLILGSLIDPTTGLQSVKKNSASLNGKGIDISLNTVNLKGKFTWQSTILFSYVSNKVTEYFIDEKQMTVGGITGKGLSIIPIKGRSPYAIYSYPYAGLDPLTGDPLGLIDGKASNDYAAFIFQLLDTAHLIYHGSAIPTTFGSFNNIFAFKGLSLTASVSYRFGYFFRKSAIDYRALYSNGEGHPDYEKRWQKPGDENFTNVPSMVYPANRNRDAFYAGSSATILKGDNIRLEYIRLSYEFNNSNSLKKWFVRGLQLYVYTSNVGIIWRANKEKLDPDYDIATMAYPPLRNFAIGLKANF